MIDAQRYERWFETPFGRRSDRIERHILADLLSGFAGAETLLDVGCGTGHFVDLWQSSGMSVVGLDISREMLQFAYRHHPEVPAVMGDATSLPFQDAGFDMASLITVLEFLPSPEAALREAGRVARQGILLGVLNSLSPVAWWRRSRRSHSYRSALFFSPGEMEDLVKVSLAGQRVIVERKTSLYPVKWLDGLTELPFGAFTGMSLRFK
jgi:ubiquinone/menaquinone biosynthesis C-methylase UbiE